MGKRVKEAITAEAVSPKSDVVVLDAPTYFKVWGTPKEAQTDELVLELVAHCINNEIPPNEINLVGNTFATVDADIDADLDDLNFVLVGEIRKNFDYRNSAGVITPLVFCSGSLHVSEEDIYDDQPAGMSMETYMKLLPAEESEMNASTWRSKKTGKVHISLA